MPTKYRTNVSLNSEIVSIDNHCHDKWQCVKIKGNMVTWIAFTCIAPFLIDTVAVKTWFVLAVILLMFASFTSIA